MEANSAANSNRLYEDFEPVCKWVREEGHDVVEVRLPGKYDIPCRLIALRALNIDSTIVHDEGIESGLSSFKREQITIKINHLGFIIISGEHPLPLGEPKWRRFMTEIRVPEYCDPDAIRAKYADHILYLIMPKKIREDDQEMERADTEFDHQKKLGEDLRVKEVKDTRKKVQFKGICALHGGSTSEPADARTEMKKSEMRVSNGTKAARGVLLFALLIALGGYVISSCKNLY